MQNQSNVVELPRKETTVSEKVASQSIFPADLKEDIVASLSASTSMNRDQCLWILEEIDRKVSDYYLDEFISTAKFGVELLISKLFKK